LEIPGLSEEVSLAVLSGTQVRPISLYLQVDNRKIMSWMKDKKFCDKDREKLEKGSGSEKFITMICNWFYRVMSW